MAAKKKSEDSGKEHKNVRQRKKSEKSGDDDQVKSTPAKKQKEKKKPASPARSPKVVQKKDEKRERRQERIKAKKAKVTTPAQRFWLGTVRPWARRHWLFVTLMTSGSLLLFALYFSVDKLDHENRKNLAFPTVTDKVTLDISVENATSGKLTIGLYGKNCPKTVENFIKLATHEKGYGYKGSRFHALFPKQMILGGDIVYNNGTGGRSALDESFEDENLKLKHLTTGTVGMIGLKNNEDSKKSSQFYITFGPASTLDGVSVVFGRVLEGVEFLLLLEGLPINQKSFVPERAITITGAEHSVV